MTWPSGYGVMDAARWKGRFDSTPWYILSWQCLGIELNTTTRGFDMEPAFDGESGVGFGMVYQPNPAQPLALMSFSASMTLAPVLYTNAFCY